MENNKWNALDDLFHELLKQKAIKNEVDLKFWETSYFHLFKFTKAPKETCIQLDGDFSVLELKLIIEVIQEIESQYSANQEG